MKDVNLRIKESEKDKEELIELILNFSDLYSKEELEKHSKNKLKKILKYYLFYDIRVKLSDLHKN